jgi:hypothetical protein
MEGMPGAMQPRDWGFPFMVFGAPAPAPDVRVAFIPVTDQQVHKLAEGLRAKLVEPPPDVSPELAARVRPGDVLSLPLPVAQIDVPGYPPLHAQIERFGQTAAMATWIHRMTVDVGTGRRSGQVQAVSLYLTGVDRAADNCAISACRQLRFGGGKALPLGSDVYQRLIEESKPVAVQIFCQQLARIDPSIQCGFLALGIAFFGTLGVEGDLPQTQ